ncbi:hypothetical protein P9112_010786 [Eukaryota sp. TZLM1-RC]
MSRSIAQLRQQFECNPPDDYDITFDEPRVWVVSFQSPPLFGNHIIKAKLSLLGLFPLVAPELRVVRHPENKSIDDRNLLFQILWPDRWNSCMKLSDILDRIALSFKLGILPEFFNVYTRIKNFVSTDNSKKWDCGLSATYSNRMDIKFYPSLTSPYAGAILEAELELPTSFPQYRPYLVFKTKIINPFVLNDGEFSNRQMFNQWPGECWDIVDVLRCVYEYLEEPWRPEEFEYANPHVIVTSREDCHLKARQSVQHLTM